MGLCDSNRIAHRAIWATKGQTHVSGSRFSQNPPKIKLCGSLFGVHSQEVRHIDFSLGTPKVGSFGWGRKVYVENVHVLFLSLSNS